MSTAAVHTPVKHRTVRAGGAGRQTGPAAERHGSVRLQRSVSTAAVHTPVKHRTIRAGGAGRQTGPAAERHGSVRLPGSR